MKARDSGMPDEGYWSTFFTADAAIERLFGVGRLDGDVVEFGCGYGTFTLPAARRTNGVVTALDIEPELVAVVRQKAAEENILNVRAAARDFVSNGTGLPVGSQSHAMIYNLLHLERPVPLLREARRVLGAGGTLSVIHWRSDIPTPRGPSVDIRPTPEQCRTWISEAGFAGVESVDLGDCCPFHFALAAAR
jgi:SAM-dependent methyltransferase